MIKVAKTADRAYLFENMPVKRAVLKQIIPAVFSQIIVLIYNLADTYFVGMLNDPIQTAAVTVSYPAFVMLTAISNLFAIGGASLLARSLGQKNEEKAKSVSVISFWGGLVCAVLFSLLFWLLAAPVLHLCGATAETYDAAFRYSKWVIIIGGAGTILNVLLSNLVRAEGNAVMAAIGVTLGGFTNIILDPFILSNLYLRKKETYNNYNQPQAFKRYAKIYSWYYIYRYPFCNTVCIDCCVGSCPFEVCVWIRNCGSRRAWHCKKVRSASALLFYRRCKWSITFSCL